MMQGSPGVDRTGATPSAPTKVPLALTSICTLQPDSLAQVSRRRGTESLARGVHVHVQLGSWSGHAVHKLRRVFIGPSVLNCRAIVVSSLQTLQTLPAFESFVYCEATLADEYNISTSAGLRILP